MLKIAQLLLACASLAAAAGCGQKGPLFLPGTPNEMRQVTPPSQPVGDEAENEDEEDEGSTGDRR